MSDDERERQVQTREQHGLRTDPAWLDWVAEHGTDGGTMMMLPIPLSDTEIDELRARTDRATATIGAFRAAGLASAAGAWLDQRAGGVVRLLLARPDADERAAAEAIVAEHGGVVELVEHSTRELEAVRALIRAEIEAGTPFGRAVTGARDDVWANADRVTLRGDLHPDIPEHIQAAVAAGTLIVEHPTEPYGWEPEAGGGAGSAATGAGPSADEPVPQWPGEALQNAEQHWAHWYRCVQFVADRCLSGPLETAQRLAEDIGLTVRVVYPGSGVTHDLRSGRITLYVNAEHVVRSADAT